MTIARREIAPLLNKIARTLPTSVPAPTRYLVPLLTATTLGHGSLFLPACLDLAYRNLPPSPQPVPQEPDDPAQDERDHPRRFTTRLIKEALVKSSILVGVPKTIELLLELGSLVHPDDRSSAFVRASLDDPDSRSRAQAGRLGLETVYKGNIDDIFATFARDGLDDVRKLLSSTGYFSEQITYGSFLTPYHASPPEFSPSPSPASSLPPSSRLGFASPDPFTRHPRLLSLVTLACLVPQQTPREIHWHLRGALRRGWNRDEVEAVQHAIEVVCDSLGTTLASTLPRVKDVDRQEEELE
ncbi:carboxymuconolactone decarboxylase family protein [Sporobolomyces koalae]|uniref:carboxymuconolactone decarboxylase family protein n=1 Tax=Sporobolomyces koalae TaxID=500713 RepID=UPI00317B0EE2